MSTFKLDVCSPNIGEHMYKKVGVCSSISGEHNRSLHFLTKTQYEEKPHRLLSVKFIRPKKEHS